MIHDNIILIMVAYAQIVGFITEGSNLIFTAVWSILRLSSCVGQTLVTQIIYVLNYLNKLFSLIITFLGVLYEDSIVFYQDLGEKCTLLAAFVASGLSHFTDGVIHTSSSVILAATETVNFVCDTTNSLTSGLLSLASLVKTCIAFTGEGFILIGSSIWLAVTRTPAGVLNCTIWILVQIRNILSGLLSYCLAIPKTVLSNVKSCFIYLSNVPCSSFLGLVIGIILFYSSLKNYKTLFSVILQISRTIYSYTSCAWYNLWNADIFRGNRQGNLNSLGADDKLCIICQDRLKEVILMPCRHVCLCIQCSLHIAKNHRYCPICRSHIQTSMKVYI